MSLRDQFVPDIDNIFMNTGEFATMREFRIGDGQGGGVPGGPGASGSVHW